MKDQLALRHVMDCGDLYLSRLESGLKCGPFDGGCAANANTLHRDCQPCAWDHLVHEAFNCGLNYGESERTPFKSLPAIEDFSD
uniref:Uncharacterized protein n=1 Tax=Pseudomonas fluorescens (strain SBW25) TaxID=216595 RepID=A0A0G4E5C5_PSEFS|nr:hypothetical protein PQBR55_0005 [Pseudomonas fluorescens SBW25]